MRRLFRGVALDDAAPHSPRSHPANRFAALDLLRLAAAIAVLFTHWSFTFPARHAAALEYPLPGAQYGWLGVELFFLISGFVILMSATGEAGPGRFLRLRAIRLYPGFWICMTITAAVTNRFDLFLPNLTMVPAWLGASPVDEAYWTLLVELQFYGLVALVLYLRQIHRAEQLLWLWLLLTWVQLPALPAMFLLQGFGCYFIGGAACCLIASRGPSRTLALLFALCWMSGIVHALERAALIARSFHADVSPVVVVVLVSVCFGVMHLVATRRIDLRPSRLLLALGGMTYPLYLLHDEIGRRLLGIDGPRHLVFWGALALMLALAWYVHRLERPIMAWLRSRRLLYKSPACASSSSSCGPPA